MLKLAFLVEGTSSRFFEQLRDGTEDYSAMGLSIVSRNETLGLTLVYRNTERICLIAGKQVATQERLEVLGLAVGESIPDGRPLRETIDRIVTCGGFPVLAWAPGKWWGQRGRIVRDFVEASLSCGTRDQPGRLALGDSSLRPVGWPEPAIMRTARERGLPILPGSDPLPLPGEEQQMGAYGFVYEGPFDLEHPVTSARALLTGDPGCIIPAGRRNNLFQVIGRLNRLRKTKQ